MEINLCMGCMREKKQPGPCPHCGFEEAVYEPSPHHLPPETVLNGKYIIGRVLGEGGFGITYLGWDINLELKVAIKEYYPNGFVTRQFTGSGNTVTILSGYRTEYFNKGLEKFVDEARRLAKFWGLPGIVAVKDYFPQNSTAYIVMEFVEGKTLKTLLRENNGYIPAAQVFDMMRPVMESLETVHEAGLIHRDISPDNIMVDVKGRVKLLDFGAARSFITDSEKSLSVMLKPGYAPEEQYRSRGKQGPWTDVYSLCATMYRAITGEVPLESLDRMAEDTIKRPSELGIVIDSHQEDALMKGMAVFQKDRYASIEELRIALFTKPEPEPAAIENKIWPETNVAPQTWAAPTNQTPIVQSATVPSKRNIWDEAYGHNEALREEYIKSSEPKTKKESMLHKAAEMVEQSGQKLGRKNLWDEIYGSKNGS